MVRRVNIDMFFWKQISSIGGKALEKLILASFCCNVLTLNEPWLQQNSSKKVLWHVTKCPMTLSETITLIGKDRLGNFKHLTKVHNVNKHYFTEWSFITKGRLVNIRNPEATQIRLSSRRTLFPPTTTWHPCLCATQWRNQNKLQPDLRAEHQKHQRRPSSQRFSCCGKLSLSVRPSMHSTWWFSIDFN